MNHSLVRTVLVAAGLTMATHAATAGEWGIGIAAATQQPPQIGVKRENLAAPYISYKGERLNIDLASISYSLYDADTFEVAILGQFRFEGYERTDSTALAGMATRDPSIDAGLRLSRSSDWGMLRLELLHDITATHDGFEARASYERHYVFGRWLLAPSVGMNWQDDSLVNYYYGVRSNEARAGRQSYTSRSTTNVFAGFWAGYSLSDNLELSAGIKHVRFGKGITDSPIVARSDQTTVVTALLYKF
jgi:MipA family protein